MNCPYCFKKFHHLGIMRHRVSCKKKYERRSALQTLIDAGTNDIRGSGRGFRSTSDEWRAKVRNAIRILFEEAYGRKFEDDRDEFNFF